MITRRSLLAGAAALSACQPRLARRFNGYCFVSSRGSQAVAVVNLTRFKVDKQIAMPGAPADLVTHGNEKFVLALMRESGTVAEISVDGMQVARRCAMGGQSLGLRVRGDSVWVLHRDPQSLQPLDLKTWERGRPIALPHAAADFDVSPDGSFAVVSYQGRKSFGLIPLRQQSALREFALAAEPGIARFRPDGKQVLVGSAAGRTITACDAGTGRISVVLPMPFAPQNFCFSTDNGGQLFTTGAGMDAVGIVYPYQTELAETVLAGHEPGPMAVNDTLLFVTNPGAGDVTVMSIAERRVLAKISAGKDPNAVALTPDGEYALVLNRGSGDLAVVRLSKLTDLRYKRAPLFTVVPVGEDPVAAVVCRL